MRRRIILTGVSVLAVLLIGSAIGWRITQRTPSVSSTSVPTTTTTIPTVTEIIEGVTVVFETRANAFRNDEARDAIARAIRAFPDHIADEIRNTTTVYVVDAPTRCVNTSLPPGSRVAGCTDGAGGSWVELIVSQGGLRPWTIVHEFGHVIGGAVQPWGTQRYASYFHRVWVSANEDNPPTRYSERFFFEDYAESFAMYVLDREALTQCCPARHAYFEELFQLPSDVPDVTIPKTPEP